MATSFRGAPLVLNEAARLQDDMGQIDAAEQLFMAAHRSPDQTVDGYVDHASMLLRTARYDRADQVIAEGTARFGNDDRPFISIQVAVADRQGKSDRREQLMARCAGYNDQRLVKDCRLAAKPGRQGREGRGQEDGHARRRQRAGRPALEGLRPNLKAKPARNCHLGTRADPG